MKVLYLECNMGAAGDMLMAALLELVEDKEGFVERMNHIGLPGVEVRAVPDKKLGIAGTHISVTINGESEGEEHLHGEEHHHGGKYYYDEEQIDENTTEMQHIGERLHHDVYSSEDKTHHFVYSLNDENPYLEQDLEVKTPYSEDNSENKTHHFVYSSHNVEHHHHHSLQDVYEIIDGLVVEGEIKADVKNIYRMIAEAESKAHGSEVSEIHFHEVGMADAIADITGCCILMHEIDADRVIVSPVKTGYGTVTCAHGVMPVPAPATAYLLSGIPTLSGNIEGELCTPTGAAVIKYFGDEFGYQPEMVTEKVGYGMGAKEFKQANCIRAMLGRMDEKKKLNAKDGCTAKVDSLSESKGYTDRVVELKCNLDDMTPEEIGYATEMLMEGKTLDVYTEGIWMKKSRPGTLLCVQCREEDEEEVVRDIFRYTSTIGIRKYVCDRYVLKRETEIVKTKLGEVRIKKSSGYGVERKKPEHEDLKKIAKEQGCSIEKIKTKTHPSL